MSRLALALLVVTSAVAGPLKAHELWIEPLNWEVESDDSLRADLVNGQSFNGIKLAYFPSRIATFEVRLGDRVVPVTARLGSTPALEMPALGDGLHVAAYVSTVSTVAYQSWDKFLSFAEHKDLGDVTAIRDAQGLPEEGFAEVYTRFSKSLIGVGSAAGEDTVLGLETELVALANPYTDDMSDGLPVQLFYQGDVRANEQVELFERAPDGMVDIIRLGTDDEGIVVLPVTPGHSYMADAVVLRLPSPELAEETGAVWESLWANLTFTVPD